MTLIEAITRASILAGDPNHERVKLDEKKILFDSSYKTIINKIGRIRKNFLLSRIDVNVSAGSDKFSFPSGAKHYVVKLSIGEVKLKAANPLNFVTNESQPTRYAVVGSEVWLDSTYTVDTTYDLVYYKTPKNIQTDDTELDFPPGWEHLLVTSFAIYLLDMLGESHRLEKSYDKEFAQFSQEFYESDDDFQTMTIVNYDDTDSI